MNTLPPIDPALAVQEATQQELTRRKQDVDALKKRLGDGTTKEEKLRESCEGFEAIFLQKMWEQMRKTVGKEGYLHSKDEETYQSLFDIELCKKMASAGGIGLGEMLYQQLSNQLEDTGRTTNPSTYRRPLQIAPSENLLPAPPEAKAPPVAQEAGTDKKLTAEALYSALPEEEAENEEQEPQELREPGGTAMRDALQALRTELGLPSEAEPSGAAAEWAAQRDRATGVAPSPEQTAEASALPADAQTVPGAAAADARAEAGKGAAENDSALTSWMPVGPVSAKPKPISSFSKRDRKAAKSAKAEKAEADNKTAESSRGMAPQGTLWPLSGEQGVVASRFGWEDDPASGRRRWNSGVRIDAAPGTPVRAVLPGTVVYAGQREGYGNTVVLDHKDGYRSYYSNLSDSALQVGDIVKHGVEFAQIGAQPSPGKNGENSASLHFELKKGEMALNPEMAIRRLTTASR